MLNQVRGLFQSRLMLVFFGWADICKICNTFGLINVRTRNRLICSDWGFRADRPADVFSLQSNTWLVKIFVEILPNVRDSQDNWLEPRRSLLRIMLSRKSLTTQCFLRQFLSEASIFCLAKSNFVSSLIVMLSSIRSEIFLFTLTNQGYSNLASMGAFSVLSMMDVARPVLHWCHSLHGQNNYVLHYKLNTEQIHPISNTNYYTQYPNSPPPASQNHEIVNNFLEASTTFTRAVIFYKWCEEKQRSILVFSSPAFSSSYSWLPCPRLLPLFPSFPAHLRTLSSLATW